MTRFARSILLLLALATTLMAVVPASAALVQTGPSKGDLEKAVEDGSKSAFESIMGHNLIGDVVIDGATKLSEACLRALLWVYRLIGTILIPIPDLADKATYAGQAGVMVEAVYRIMVILGVFLALVCFVSYVGPSATGLAGREVSASAAIRLVVAITLIFVWPSIFSFTSRMASDIGYLIFGQNRLNTSGVLSGITDLKTDSTTTKTGLSNERNSMAASSNIQASMTRIWRIVLALALFLCMIGILYAGFRISRGDPNGYKVLVGAVFGIILIVSAQYLIQYLFREGAVIGSKPLPGESADLITGQQAFQNGQAQLPGMTSGAVSDTQLDENAVDFVAALLKILISLWGVVICIGVLFAKFMQVISLLIVFFLGPIFAGLTAHPRTESISRSGLNLMIKLQLYSVIWAIALLGLYLVENIRFGDETLGAGNILTAFAVLAGLMIVEKSQDFAGLLANSSGVGNFGNAGGALGGFFKTATGFAMAAGSVPTKAAGAVKGGVQALSRSKGQAVAGLAGAAVGSLLPGVGTIAGAAAGVRMTQGVNRMASVTAGGAMGGMLVNRLDKLIAQGKTPGTNAPKRDMGTLQGLSTKLHKPPPPRPRGKR